MDSAHKVILALVSQRLREAIDLEALLECENGLEDAMRELGGGHGLDPAAIIDEAWRRVEAEWRRIRVMECGDEPCPLCPPGGISFDLDITQPEPVIAATVERAIERATRPRPRGRG